MSGTKWEMQRPAMCGVCEYPVKHLLSEADKVTNKKQGCTKNKKRKVLLLRQNKNKLN